LFVIFVIFCFFSEVAFHFLESCPPAGSNQIQPGLPALQPRQKHASPRICELSSQLRARGEVGGWPHPHPRKRGEILSRLDLVSPAFRADASIGKSSRPQHLCRLCCGRFVAGRKSAETRARSPLLSLILRLVQTRTGTGRVQCSFCRDLA